jgi:hypothetical protein
MAYTTVLVYVTVRCDITLFYLKVMDCMKWRIYDTFADQNLFRYQNYIEWEVTVFSVYECAALVDKQRFAQWSTFGGLHFGHIICDIVILQLKV